MRHDEAQCALIDQDIEVGVIGIPQNSPYGKKDYRKQALNLMADHFPDGFEIVRAEEVIEGQRVLDRSRKLDLATDPSISALNQSISLGEMLMDEKSRAPDVEMVEADDLKLVMQNTLPSSLTAMSLV